MIKEKERLGENSGPAPQGQEMAEILPLRSYHFFPPKTLCKSESETQATFFPQIDI